jgi:alpha(1,3/1,4) fucosyltransferase
MKTDTLKIYFVDFWNGFHANNNYFHNILKTKYNVIIDNTNPDILFYSMMGKKHLDYNCKKICFSGESVSSPHHRIESKENYDLLLCHRPTNSNDKIYRLPLWVTLIDWTGDPEANNEFRPGMNMLTDRNICRTRSKFCNFTYKRPVSSRIKIFNRMCEYKQVESTGALLNNSPRVPGIHSSKSKIDMLEQYKFAIASENTLIDGYVTEKIFQSLVAGCIPVYYGTEMVFNDFNSNCFVYVSNPDDMDDAMEEIVRIDSSIDAWREKVAHPVFNGNAIAEELTPGAVLDIIDSI